MLMPEVKVQTFVGWIQNSGWCLWVSKNIALKLHSKYLTEDLASSTNADWTTNPDKLTLWGAVFEG